MNVKRADLIKQLMDKHGYTKKGATELVDDFTEIILDNLRHGDSVSLRNFGCFDILERAARRCPDPQTGVMIDVPAHWIPRFYPSSRMRLKVKEWEDSSRRGIE